MVTIYNPMLPGEAESRRRGILCPVCRSVCYREPVEYEGRRIGDSWKCINCNQQADFEPTLEWRAECDAEEARIEAQRRKEAEALEDDRWLYGACYSSKAGWPAEWHRSRDRALGDAHALKDSEPGRDVILLRARRHPYIRGEMADVSVVEVVE